MKLKNKFQTIESSNSEIRDDNVVIKSQFNSFFKLFFILISAYFEVFVATTLYLVRVRFCCSNNIVLSNNCVHCLSSNLRLNFFSTELLSKLALLFDLD